MARKSVKPDPCTNFVRTPTGRWLLEGMDVPADVAKRLNDLHLPPAWTDVAVATDPEARVVAVGKDKVGKWQYRFSAKHIEESSRKKFARCRLFGEDINSIRRKVEKGVKSKDPMSLLLRLEDLTAIRAGSTVDTKAVKKAYGLTTLQNEHVIIKGNKAILDFTAKKGVPAHYEVSDRAVVSWLKDRKKATSVGERLFPDISARKMNVYIREISGKKYSLKDFRTYHGTRIAYEELEQYAGKVYTVAERKKIVNEVSQKVSSFLHNTPAMARSAYIDPMVWDVIGGLPKKVKKIKKIGKKLAQVPAKTKVVVNKTDWSHVKALVRRIALMTDPTSIEVTGDDPQGIATIKKAIGYWYKFKLTKKVGILSAKAKGKISKLQIFLVKKMKNKPSLSEMEEYLNTVKGAIEEELLVSKLAKGIKETPRYSTTLKETSEMLSSDKIIQYINNNTDAKLDLKKLRDTIRSAADKGVWGQRDVLVSGLKVDTKAGGMADIEKVKLSNKPIVVDTDGYVIDGRHRVLAVRKKGQERIRAWVPIISK